MKRVVLIAGEEVTLEVHEQRPGAVRFELEGKEYAFSLTPMTDSGQALSETNGEAEKRWPVAVSAPDRERRRRICLENVEAWVGEKAQGGRSSGQQMGADGCYLAPMSGTVTRVAVKEGEKVACGQILAVMEAMKMQLEIKASAAGMVRSVEVASGQKVSEGALLVKVEAQQ